MTREAHCRGNRAVCTSAIEHATRLPRQQRPCYRIWPLQNFVDVFNAREQVIFSTKTLELLPPPETMFRAPVNRDPSFEGIFYVGVRTTRIFCRPTCTAIKPARENVDFFARQTRLWKVVIVRAWVATHSIRNAHPPKLIERLRADVEPAPGEWLTDKELAALSIDPSTARRQFKRHYGMTFQAYHRARRMGLALDNAVRQARPRR